MIIPDAVLVAGPTASGKSAFALRRAAQISAEGRHPLIVNADSMQVYPVLEVLTARPREGELERAEHLLYGHVDPSTAYSAAQWLDDVRRIVVPRMAKGEVPIFTGGTGLYFRALEEGLDPVPQIAPQIRAAIRRALVDEGASILHQRLEALDPVGAGSLRVSDGQRIARALEVVESTGEPMHVHHQRAQAEGKQVGLLSGLTVERWIVEPSRAVLHQRIAARAEAMIAHGARDEARALAALGLRPEATVLKAIGLRQLGQLERGERTIEDAKSSMIAKTRQYAKRQSTWFRGQMGPNWHRIAGPGEPTALT